MHQSYVKLTDIKSCNILSVKVDHICMGDTTLTLIGKKFEPAAPGELFFSYKTVVIAIKKFNQIVA